MSFVPSLKQNFIAYRSSEVSLRPDCIFDNHQLWQSVLVGCIPIVAVAEIIEIGQSSHKMYSNNILNFFRVYDNFKCPYEKRLEIYWRHHVFLEVVSFVLIVFHLSLCPIFACCRTFLIYVSCLISHPDFDFLFVFFGVNPFIFVFFFTNNFLSCIDYFVHFWGAVRWGMCL